MHFIVLGTGRLNKRDRADWLSRSSVRVSVYGDTLRADCALAQIDNLVTTRGKDG